MSLPYIANVLNVHRTTVWREVRRNCNRRNNAYRTDLAERKARERMAARKRKCEFTDSIWVSASTSGGAVVGSASGARLVAAGRLFIEF